MGERPAGGIIHALDPQTGTVIVLPLLAQMLSAIRESRDTVLSQSRSPCGGPPYSPGPDVTPAGGREDPSTGPRRDRRQRLRIRRAGSWFPTQVSPPRPGDPGHPFTVVTHPGKETTSSPGRPFAAKTSLILAGGSVHPGGDVNEWSAVWGLILLPGGRQDTVQLCPHCFSDSVTPYRAGDNDSGRARASNHVARDSRLAVPPNVERQLISGRFGRSRRHTKSRAFPLCHRRFYASTVRVHPLLLLNRAIASP